MAKSDERRLDQLEGQLQGLAFLGAIILEEIRDRDLNRRVRGRVEALVDGIEETLREGRSGTAEDLDKGRVSFLKRFATFFRP